VSRICRDVFNVRPEGRTTRGWLSEAKSGFKLHGKIAKFPRATVDPGLGQPGTRNTVHYLLQVLYIPMSPARWFQMLGIFDILARLSGTLCIVFRPDQLSEPLISSSYISFYSLLPLSESRPLSEWVTSSFPVAGRPSGPG
jgi:hypothetical protein